VEYRRNELLTTHGLHITNVLAEPGQVVISVARPERQVVSLVDVWRNRTRDSIAERSNDTLVLGVREADGETLYLSPGDIHAPHTLIAGTTGSGKSVLIQNLLLDIAATNDCANAQIILIDPKQGADYLDLHLLPHIQRGITVTQQSAQEALEWAVAEMDRRYELFSSVGVANLSRYNAKVPPAERQPRIWLFHDEFAVWMLVDDYKELVSNTVQRLGVMARAATGWSYVWRVPAPRRSLSAKKVRSACLGKGTWPYACPAQIESYCPKYRSSAPMRFRPSSPPSARITRSKFC
jgi:S-DNA-T family DNA segregation ATPase FtsK/SpoIIIE